jgi:hypothetical protein
MPGRERWSAAIGRYLAARAFANWVGYYGSSLDTWYSSILAAYSVFLASAAARSDGAPLERDALLGAFGDADHLMLHLASAEALAAALDELEER